MTIPRIPCAKCHKRHLPTVLTLIDKQYYRNPYGPCLMQGGEYLHAEYAFQCPSCQMFNRLLTISHERDPWMPHAWAPESMGGGMFKDGSRCPTGPCRSKATPLLKHFSRVELIYDDYPGKWINNFF